MNLIKLKDVLRPGDEIFNTHLKGKYAYWIQMHYIVPFEFLSTQEYIALEQDISLLLDQKKKPATERIPYYDTQSGDILAWIDADETDRLNNLGWYQRANLFVTDSDLTLDELKKFRSWLPAQLLEFDQDSNGVQTYTLYSKPLTEALRYYSNGMTDYASQKISEMDALGSNAPWARIENQRCCQTQTYEWGGTSEPSSTLEQYHQYNKKILITNLSRIEFWTQFPVEFLSLVRKYISNIRRAQLHLGTNYKENLEPAFAFRKNLSEQTETYAGALVLDSLIDALDLLIDSEIDGHRNQITKALNDWLTDVYELMIWQ